MNYSVSVTVKVNTLLITINKNNMNTYFYNMPTECLICNIILNPIPKVSQYLKKNSCLDSDLNLHFSFMFSNCIKNYQI